MGRTVQGIHHVACRVTTCIGRIILERGVAGQRNAYEVHKVIARESHRQCECSGEDKYLEDIDFQCKEDLGKDGRDDEADSADGPRMGVYPLVCGIAYERYVPKSFNQHEIDDGGECQATEDADFPFQGVVLVNEGEECPRNVLDEGSDHERDGHGDENRHDHREGLAGIHQVSHVKRRITRHFHQCQRECSSEEFKHH